MLGFNKKGTAAQEANNTQPPVTEAAHTPAAEENAPAKKRPGIFSQKAEQIFAPKEQPVRQTPPADDNQSERKRPGIFSPKAEQIFAPKEQQVDTQFTLPIEPNAAQDSDSFDDFEALEPQVDLSQEDYDPAKESIFYMGLPKDPPREPEPIHVDGVPTYEPRARRRYKKRNKRPLSAAAKTILTLLAAIAFFAALMLLVWAVFPA